MPGGLLGTMLSGRPCVTITALDVTQHLYHVSSEASSSQLSALLVLLVFALVLEFASGLVAIGADEHGHPRHRARH